MGRRLGQHFLTKGAFLERIAKAACGGGEPFVIEIGPGRGALTSHLIPHTQRLLAIELDSQLAAGLRSRFPAVEVVEADVLSVDLAQWGPAVIAGNLPYYICSPILDRTLALGSLLRAAVFLVQHEVAQRLVAKPGTRDYGYLTVRTQLRAEVELLFAVPASAFHPPPKVESAVVRLKPSDVPLVRDVEGFLKFAAMCFHMKRKNLRNNLSGSYPMIRDLPQATLRAEQLSLPDLVALYLSLAVRQVSRPAEGSPDPDSFA
ncbi:MAG: ribosomal RNA small subunit methyltransferase A [Candidatus Solibacter usitatus]|nr:ribosomal RNA small subunit methyltransferase A [Candidatus Solibacter usitatus]